MRSPRMRAMRYGDFRTAQDDYKRALKDMTSVLPRVFRFLWEVSPVLVAINGLLMLITAGIPASLVWMGKVIVDGVIAAVASKSSWLALAGPLTLILSLWIAQAVLQAISNLVNTMLRERSRIHADAQILEKAASVDFALYESPRYYDLLQHATRYSNQVTSLALSVLSLLQQILSLGMMASLLALLHPLAIVVLFATALPTVLMQRYYARKRYELDAQLIRNNRSSWYMRDLVAGKRNAKELRIFSLKRHFKSKFMEYRTIAMNLLIKLQIHFMKYQLTLNVLSLSGVAGIYTYGVIEAVAENITIGELTAVFTAAMTSNSQLQGLVRSGGQLFENTLFITRFFQFLDLDPDIVDGSLEPPRDDEPLPVPVPMRKGVEFENVSFVYPGNEEVVLDSVSFSIPVGGKLAIVGQNGAGKTTIIKLLSRLYDPTSGRVLLDGVDLREYSLPELRTAVSVVFQDYMEYDLSVSENIGVGEIDEIDNTPRIIDTAQRSGVSDMIERLPQGYETQLGKIYSEGVNLSGGEWQHLAISRALMSDAQILILDEPTAALDAIREHQLYERFADATLDQTVVFISHRFSTVRMADTIVVVEGGRVTEVGSHEDLVSRGGMYATMFNTQAARYG